MITFDRHPDNYRHWRLSVDGPVATLTLAVDEDGGLVPGYQLKLNSYDLGVDIELHDALQRIRFEHPTVRTVVITSGLEKMFCAGANIYMLGTSSHGWKVNFCKFTNETRNSIEDSSRYSGIRFLAACNGTTAGGGYELALACDEIFLIDDRSSAVSLPEVPLLGVLPGTGGLTRLTDKRKVRHDLADVFCTNPDGVRGRRAKDWRLVDEVVPRNSFDEKVKKRARELAADSRRPEQAEGIILPPLARKIDDLGYHYRHVDVTLDATLGCATLTVSAPDNNMADTLKTIHEEGANWWPLAMARELDDAILMLRANNEDIGTILLKTRGDIDNVLRVDAILAEQQEDWLVREVIGMLRRTLARLDVSSRSLFALVEEGSCFAGTLYELALAADRIYMLDIAEEDGNPPHIALSPMNFGAYVAVNSMSRLARRFYEEETVLNVLKQQVAEKIGAIEAEEKGLVTFIPDDIDWEEEIRLLIEERASLSPDALTGLEANLRFGGRETAETKIFGRLSAWQNWIFNRPNAVGEKGALKLFGSGTKAEFDKRRV
ncbi:benzoyl-CoA-dihydrodiol lyase [Sneathiella chungangensis]|uniref:Benzoyl-CoA-dihydrodiol lyase n=1 Tax=Sneathiella chungangensis TaxID=1418234 RepID=A0A845MHV2_9PROT|nr:2,3-epoxybenzoyl-CoA dihydrolase [Sneathiella chungangensis]MZR23010.1 benzoyl-CoA-dihydrodiol lyase [Sneathiella chungangensis]